MWEKKWPNDLKVGCKSLFSLIHISEIDVKLENELKKFEGAFEKDKIVKV